MSEEQTSIEDNIVTDDALGAEEQNESTPDYSEMEQEKLIEMLQEKDGELSKSKKSYEEYRSMNDRQSGELRERLARLEGTLSAQPKQQEAEVDYDGLTKDLREQLDEDPTKAADMIVQLTQEVNALMSEREKSLQQSFEEKLASKLAGMNPVYKEHKDTVDELVGTGMSLDQAMSFVEKHMGSSKVKQPGTPNPPSVVTAGRTTGGKGNVGSVDIPKFEMETFRLAGLSEDDIKQIAKEAAEEQR